MIKKMGRFLLWKLGRGNKKRNRVVYVSERKDWVIKRIGNYILSQVKAARLSGTMEDSPEFYYDALIHFGCFHFFAHEDYRKVHSSNKMMLTVYHGNYGINEEFDRGLNVLRNKQHLLAALVAANSIMKDRLVRWGIPGNKITLIPLGVDRAVFSPNALRRRQKRQELGIPEDALCIGSFQKDGNGWGEGLSPKIIKGPDIFLEAVGQLARRHKIHCLLTGPARGYVKKGLSERGVPYTHVFLRNFPEIVDYYRCLDLYLITSREEGGPEALPEAMAAGVPIVTTRVGMAPDMIASGENGCMTAIDDIPAIVKSAEALLNDQELRAKITRNGLATAEKYGWDNIGKQYVELYKKILA